MKFMNKINKIFKYKYECLRYGTTLWHGDADVMSTSAFIQIFRARLYIIPKVLSTRQWKLTNKQICKRTKLLVEGQMFLT